jgi:AcrR family transcriptional regulator
LPKRPVRDRILEATYTCVARDGLARTTIEDAARQARVSRATVYRYFPGGRDELMREVIADQTVRFFVRLADAVAGVSDFASLLEEALIFAHRAIEEHEVLQRILQTEPALLIPTLTVESDRIRPAVASFLVTFLEKEWGSRPAVPSPQQAADYLARMIMSFIATPGRWDLTDRSQVAALVQTELLAGIRQAADD